MNNHITNFSIENFKVFRNKTEFEFAPITILTGKNSSGKSSLIRAFQFLELCFKNGEIVDVIDIEEELNILGDFSKIINENNNKNKLFFTFYLPITLRGILKKLKLKISYTKDSKFSNEGRLSEIVIFEDEDKIVPKQIFEITETKLNNFNLRIDYKFFLDEYIRESESIKRYKENVLTKEEYPTGIHLEYHNYLNSLNNKPLQNENNWNYKPFFDKYPGFFNEPVFKNILNFKYSYTDFEYYNKKNKILLTPFIFDFYENKSKNSLLEKEFEKEFLENSRFQIVFSANNLPKEKYTKSLFLNFNSYIKVFLGHRQSFDQKDKILLMENYFKNSKTLIEAFNDPYANIGKGLIFTNEFFFDCFVRDNIIYSINESLNQIKNNYYLSSYRNQINRSYNIKDGTEFQKLIKEIKIAQDLNPNNKIIRFIKKYLTRLEIAHSFRIVKDDAGQGYQIFLLKNKSERLLADMGYGISQVLPIIFKIVSIALSNKNHKRLFIEEPESNLHPSLQSKLAEVFVDALKFFNIQFIIETHSDYFIRKLQVLTANSYFSKNNIDGRLPILKSEDSVIYYFKDPEKILENEDQVYRINIEKDGSLSKNFGVGFFDEASNLNIALYRMSKANKN